MLLKTMVEQYSQFQPDLTRNERMEIARPFIFKFDYKLFDPAYKKTFETNILRRFYMQEIGFETEEYFLMELEDWFAVNMGYYNKLFESELIEFEPLQNVDWKETMDKKKDKAQTDKRDTGIDVTAKADIDSKNTNDTKVEEKLDGFNRDIVTNTPDTRLAITTENGRGVIEYATGIDENKRDDITDTTSHSTDVGNQAQKTSSNENREDNLKSDVNETEDYLRHIVGKVGNASYSELLEQYRGTFLRIERDIHRELRQLFMLVY